VLGGDAPVESSIGFAVTEPADIINTAITASLEALDLSQDRNAAFMYSCAGRNWSLGASDMAEHEAVRDTLFGSLPFFFAYSGGELYPQINDDGTIINTLQNHSLIVCVL